MPRFVPAVVPAVVLSLVGCGGGNPPAQMPTLSPEQIAAEEKHSQEVSAVEKQREKALSKAVYIPREEAAVNEAEAAHEAAIREERNQKDKAKR